MQTFKFYIKRFSIFHLNIIFNIMIITETNGKHFIVSFQSREGEHFFKNTEKQSPRARGVL